jgi:hypothetical protein
VSGTRDAVRRSELVLLRNRRGHASHMPDPAACAIIPERSNSSFAWKRGDIQDEIASTWVGYWARGRSYWNR